MNNLFNLDNPFFTFLSKAVDVLFLSIVYTLLCLPVITIGPATTAMYYATVKVIRRERGYLFREFFRSFKLNFKRAAIIGIILTLMCIIISVDINMVWSSKNGKTTYSIMFGIYLAIALLLLSFSIYVFPVISRFELKINQLIKVVFFMSVKHLPSTFAMLIILIVAIGSVRIIPILIFIIPALTALICSFFMERIFKKYMPKSEGNPEETGKDEWYLE